MTTMSVEVPKVELIDNNLYFYTNVDVDSALLVNKLLRQAEKNELWNGIKHNTVPSINMYINSYGGYIHDMFSIIDTMCILKVPVHTYIEGIAGSAASLIALSGAKRFITKHSFIMIHQIQAALWGTHQQFEDDLVVQKMVMRKMINLYAARTKLTKKEINKKMKHDWWVDAVQAKKMGMVDKIL